MSGWRRFSFILLPVKNIGCSGNNRKEDLKGENREESIAQVKDNPAGHVIQRILGVEAGGRIKYASL